MGLGVEAAVDTFKRQSSLKCVTLIRGSKRQCAKLKRVTTWAETSRISRQCNGAGALGRLLPTTVPATELVLLCWGFMLNFHVALDPIF